VSPEQPDLTNLEEVNRVALTNFRRIRKYLEAAGAERSEAGETRKTFRRTSSPSSRDPKPLADLLDDFTIQADLSAPLAVGGLSFRWDEIVGEEVAEHVSISEFEESTGILRLAADSTAWATQIRMLVPQIALRIDEEIGADIVKEITVAAPSAPSWTFGKRKVPGRGPRDTYG
jgi:predicted nucleic acid-binding Zn ribbon protein